MAEKDEEEKAESPEEESIESETEPTPQEAESWQTKIDARLSAIEEKLSHQPATEPTQAESETTIKRAEKLTIAEPPPEPTQPAEVIRPKRKHSKRQRRVLKL